MDQQAVWDDLVGAAWVEHADALDVHSGPFGAAAMDALAPASGESVLDIGCGTGQTTRRLAARVGDAGRVTGIDLSSRMIDAARDQSIGSARITYEVADVTTLALDDPVDAIFSRFGVMFFDQPVAAFAHLRTLVRSGGRLGFCCWQDPFSNPWMLVPVMASAAVLGPPELPGPGEPGPFSLGDATAITALLTEAGWADVTTADLVTEDPFPGGSAAHITEMVLRTNPVLAAGLAKLPERHEELESAVTAALAEHERNGKVVLAAKATIVTATAGS